MCRLRTGSMSWMLFSRRWHELHACAAARRHMGQRGGGGGRGAAQKGLREGTRVLELVGQGAQQIRIQKLRNHFSTGRLGEYRGVEQHLAPAFDLIDLHETSRLSFMHQYSACLKSH
jgi:hypothetical protein